MTNEKNRYYKFTFNWWLWQRSTNSQKKKKKKVHLQTMANFQTKRITGYRAMLQLKTSHPFIGVRAKKKKKKGGFRFMNEIEEHILRRSLEGGWIISRMKITPDLSHAEGHQRLVFSHKARYDRYTFTTPCMQREPRAVCVGGRLSQRRESIVSTKSGWTRRGGGTRRRILCPKQSRPLSQSPVWKVERTGLVTSTI